MYRAVVLVLACPRFNLEPVEIGNSDVFAEEKKEECFGCLLIIGCCRWTSRCQQINVDSNLTTEQLKNLFR